MKLLKISTCKRSDARRCNRGKWIAITPVFLFLMVIEIAPALATSTAFYADNGLQQTVLVEPLKGRQKREMQQEILTLLGLHHRPKPKTHGKDDSAPKFMIDLYKSLYEEGGLENSVDDTNEIHLPGHLNVSQFGGINSKNIDGSDVIMSFVNHDLRNHRSSRCPRRRRRPKQGYSAMCRRSAGKVPHLRHERHRTYFFDFSEVSQDESVTGAELRVYKERRRKLAHERLRVEVFKIKQGTDPEDKILESESNTTVYGEDEGWLDLNVTRAAEIWTNFPATNLGLYIRVTDSRGKEYDPKKIGIVGRKGPTDKQPFMVSYFKMNNGPHVRRTRAANRKRPSQDVSYSDEPYYPYGPNSYHRFRQKACQRRTLYVSFRDLGWQDWIIAPEGYSAFYCDGECSFPLGAHMNATNHAIVQTLVHLMEPYLVPKPCCAPTKLSSISVLYFDHNSNVVLKKYKGMIVKSCGCH